MKHLITGIRNLVSDEGAATAVEYAVMMVLIVVVCITAIQLLGGSVESSLGDTRDQLEEKLNSGN